jgi:F0F1-type ATP synthase membrane subunit c/vacuolar-type H+-ATPase subunit K
MNDAQLQNIVLQLGFGHCHGAGWSREALLSYLPAFFAAGIACVVASIAILTIRKQSAEAILTTPAE